MQLKLRGREYVIEKRLPDGTIRIRDIVTDERSAMPEQEIVEAVFGNGAELLGHNRNQELLKERLKKTGVCDIGCLSEDDPRRKELDRRISYVRAVETARVDRLTRETLEPVIKKVANTIADASPPSISTVCRWLHFYRESGNDVRALVPATKARGNRQRRFFGRRLKNGELRNDPKAQERAAKVVELLDQAIDEVYLKEQRFTVQAVHDALLVKIDDANRFRDHDDQLPEPSKSRVYDAVSKLDDYDVIEARYGKKIADEKYRAVIQGPRPTRPLERVECDHTITDLFVIDPVMMLPIGRAYLTWMICVYTKMILGFYISFNIAWPTGRPSKSIKLRNQDLHELYSRAYSVFENWPHNFHQFLSKQSRGTIRLNPDDGKLDTALKKEFGSFYEHLFRDLDGAQFDFMRNSFAEFLTNRLRSQSQALNEEDLQASLTESETDTYTSLAEARRLLKISHRALSELIGTGELRFVIKSQVTTLKYLVRLSDVQNLKGKFEQSLSTRSLARILGVECEEIRELARAGHLRARWRPAVDDYRTIKYDYDSARNYSSSESRIASSAPAEFRQK